ncbi:unnamed protein product [Rhizophagus irregularis]|nr:unnamed protein product [Rhizophagus irregularis]
MINILLKKAFHQLRSVFGLLPLECDLDSLNGFDFRRFGLDYERGRVFLVLGLQRLLFAAIGYWTSEWANKMQLLG